MDQETARKTTGSSSSRGRNDHRRRGRKKEQATSQSQTETTSAPKVLLLRPKEDSPGHETRGTETVTQTVSPSRSQSQSPLSQPIVVSGDVGIESPAPDGKTSRRSSVEDKTESSDKSTIQTSLVKLIDCKTWSLCYDSVVNHLSSVNCQFKVVSVVGPPSSGKSSLMNHLAGGRTFPSHSWQGVKDKDLLHHLTQGVDMFITNNRLLLLDSQPLLSSSILDDLISGVIPIQSVFPGDAFNETDAMFITSMQIISFLLSVSDCLIITCLDGFLDMHLMKMLATCIQIMSASPRQLNLIWYLSQKTNSSQVQEIQECLHSIFGRSNITVINADAEQVKRRVSSISTGREKKLTAGSSANKSSVNLSETSWLKSAQVFWEKLIKKPSLFLDYDSLPLK